MMEESGFDSWQEEEIFLLFMTSRTALGAHLTSYTMGTVGSFLGVKAAGGRNIDHSPATSAEVKNGGDLPPLPFKA
jgi:hypothetical protein